MSDEHCEMPAFQPTSQEILDILKSMKTIAVVGASPKPERPSHDGMRYLMSQGYRVIPVNPGQREVLGEKCYPSLLDIPEPVDVVDIFLSPENIPPVVDQAIAKGVKTVWMQSGIVHNQAGQKAKDAGLRVVMNRCLKTEHFIWKRGQ
jgi:hypothetical protein